jgi:cyclic pyranopterin monophosphate synthase
VKSKQRRGSSALTHLNQAGQARMVDVSAKPSTRRAAAAEAWVEVGSAIARRLRRDGGLAKGEVLGTARLAGIMAAKRAAELIPMCHPLALASVDLSAKVIGHRVVLVARVSAQGPTGVEMEALTAVAVAALTVYDMIKSAGKGVQIGPIRLLEKQGGKSGHWKREAGDGPR